MLLDINRKHCIQSTQLFQVTRQFPGVSVLATSNNDEHGEHAKLRRRGRKHTGLQQVDSVSVPGTAGQ